jgi:hypothetical protein
MKAFENRMLMKIFGLMIGKWQEYGENYIIRMFIIFILNHLLLRWPNQKKLNFLDMYQTSWTWEICRRSEGKRPIEGSGHRSEGIIKMDLNEILCGDMDWIHLCQDRLQWRALVNISVKFRVRKRRKISWLAERQPLRKDSVMWN